MDPLVKYKDDFEEIVDLVWQVHLSSQCSMNTFGKTSSHITMLGKELLNIRNSYWSTFTIEKEDIQQELACLWLKYYQRFQQKKRKRTSLRDYLLSCTVWGMKSWYRSQVIGMSHNPEMVYHSSEQTTGSCSENLWTLENLLSIATMVPFPLSQLRPYERYLIFLKYKMEKNTVEIAYIVQKDRRVVKKQLDQIHTKLRSLADETKDSG